MVRASSPSTRKEVALSADRPAAGVPSDAVQPGGEHYDSTTASPLPEPHPAQGKPSACSYDRPMAFPRISHDPAVMGGKPCIRGLRITVGTIVGLVASGSSRERILQAYPLLEPADIDEALAYAAWRMEEREEALVLS
jgi:uncharacterized protein (DUF433 family)